MLCHAALSRTPCSPRGACAGMKRHVDDRTIAHGELQGIFGAVWEALAMAETLEQQIAMCQRRMVTIAGLIKEERAAGLNTEDAERVLALEARFLRMLQDMLEADDPGAKG